MKWLGFGAVAALVVAAATGFIASFYTVAQRHPAADGVTIQYRIVSSGSEQALVGPDGRRHDTFVALGSTNVRVGERVTIVVANFDDMPHGMVFPDLGIAKMIAAGTEGKASTTTFSFVASKAGILRWYCPVPCDTDSGQWAMKTASDGPGQEGFMAGRITVA